MMSIAKMKRCNSNVVIVTMVAFLVRSVVVARPERSLFQMAGYGEEKLSTVIVTGTVLCQPPPPHPHTWPIQGASVGIKCHTKEMKGGKSSWSHGVTDDYGDFIVDLPSHLHATPNLHTVCTFKVLRLPNNSLCRPTYVGKHSAINFSSATNGVRTYSTGAITLQPKPSKEIIKKSRKYTDDK